MIRPLHQTIRSRIAAAVAQLYGIDADDPLVRGLPIESPPNRALGDLAVPLAFELARRLRKAPRAIAQEIAGALGPIEGVANVQAAPNGYLNLFLDRRWWLLAWLRPAGAGGAAAPPHDGKVIVEHTAINPNKAAHIGHLRNAALGDTFVRLLRFQALPVEVQNYIDDTGVQVADVVVGFRELEHQDLDAVHRVAESTRFDYYCWDLYARVTEWYEADRTRLQTRAATLREIEHDGTATAAMAHFIADRIVRCHLRTMKRMNVEYDLLTWEGDILRLQFWAHAFERLKQQGAVFLQREGRLAGCWVMRIEEDPLASGADEAEDQQDEQDEQREKVIVRSDGTVTYVGKDIAYQLWKFGLLGKDFHYRLYERNGHPVWATSADAQPGAAGAPEFGHASATYNVIDTRQTYLQKLLKQALVAIGHPAEAEHSHHFSYEMVALSHRTARELGYESSEEGGRPFVEVSGRKGLGVKADDLLDRLIDKATVEVARRNPEFAAGETRQIAEAIAIAAVRYFMVKFSRGKIIAFDIDEALSFEGESGPYLQYAVVRANNIFHKLRDREGTDERAVLASLPDTPAGVLTEGPEADDLWGLVLEAARLDEVVDQSVRTLELSVLAKYAFGLAQSFNAFYHRYPILNEERVEVRRWRAAVVSYFRMQMTRALDLMGCTVPPRM
jgi:arginyl-tRNA synthetase